MNLKESQRQLNRYSRFFEPLMVVLLMALIILPTVSALNISPETKLPPTRPSSVLGVTDNPGMFGISKILENANFLSNESLLQKGDNHYTYRGTLRPRLEGRYQKGILKISNGLEVPARVTFTIRPTDSTSEIGIVNNNTNYVLSDSKGNLYPYTFEAQPGEHYISLRIYSDSTTNFSEEIEIDVKTELDTVVE